MKEKKGNHRQSLEEVVQNNIVNHGPLKASVHPVDNQITRETAFKSAQIIIDFKIIVNSWKTMPVIIVDCQILMLVIQQKFLVEPQRKRHSRGMYRASEYTLLNQIQIQQIVLLNKIFYSHSYCLSS